MNEKKFSRFSVPLGLLDYVNPILYSITIITIIRNTGAGMGRPYSTILITGAVISIFFGFIIPTGKVIVGLGLIQFVMPVSLVFCVNTGILMSGLMLLKYVTGMRSGSCHNSFSSRYLFKIREDQFCGSPDRRRRISAAVHFAYHFVGRQGHDASGHYVRAGDHSLCDALWNRYQSRSEESEGALGHRDF